MDNLERLIFWLLQGSAGAPTRLRLVRALHAQPRNAQQIADALEMDYTTIQHHLRVLTANRLVETAGERYGRVYFLSSNLESRWDALEALTAPRGKGGGGR